MKKEAQLKIIGKHTKEQKQKRAMEKH